MDLWSRDSDGSLVDSSVLDAGDTLRSGDSGLESGNLSWAANENSANGAGSLLWQATLFAFEEMSAAANSITLDSKLNEVLDLVWTATGGSGQPPITLPHAPENPFLNGFPQSLGLLPSSSLVWVDTSHLLGAFSGGTGQPSILADSGNNAGAGEWNASMFGAAAADGNGAGSLLWQATLFGFEELSAAANSSALDSALNQALGVVWTATGGSGLPPVTLPHAPENPFVNGFVQLTPAQLVWTDPSAGAPTLFNDHLTGVLAPLNPLFTRA